MTDNNMATRIDSQPVDDLRNWLETQASEHGLLYLLAHADDGVIWGRFPDGRLIISGEVFPEVAVKLRPKTLQQARLFGPAGEVLLWRVEGGFRSNVTIDDADKSENDIEESHHLWGAGKILDTEKQFTLMEDGQQGLRHAIPCAITEHNYAALRVRHYVAYDEQNQAYIARSRLVDLLEISGETS